jgi:hypothetical protein
MSRNAFDKFAYVKALRGAPMTLAQRCVLMQVWDYSNADGTNAYAGVQRIADDIGANERTVRRSLQWLCDTGWLRKESTGGRSGDGAHWASVYSLATPTQPDIRDPQADIEYISTGHSRPSSGPQTLPPEPVSPEPVSPEPVSPEPDPSNPHRHLGNRDTGVSAADRGRELVLSGKYSPSYLDDEPPF